MKIANDLSYYLNMTWDLDSLDLYRSLDPKLKNSDALFFKIIDDLVKASNFFAIRILLSASDEDIIDRNIVKLAQKYPQSIINFITYMTKDQVLNFIKTTNPSLLIKHFRCPSMFTFKNSAERILEDKDVQIALIPIFPDPVLRSIYQHTKNLLEIGRATNWHKNFYKIIPLLQSRTVTDDIVNSHEFPTDFKEKVRNLTERLNQEQEERIRQEREREERREYPQDEDSVSDAELTINIQLREKEYAYLFRKNIHKLALRLYKGNKKSVYNLFNLYSSIVDIRSNTFSNTLKKGFNLWVGIVKEQSKQFTPDERIIKEIGLSLKAVENFLNTHKVIDLKNKTDLYKTARYHNLIKDLVSYMVSFFNHLGIKVKPLPIVSSVTGIKLIALTPNTDEEDAPIEEQFSLVNQMKNKLTESFLSNIHINPEEDVEKQVKGISYYETSEGFVSLDTLKTYSSLEELLEDVKNNKIIDKNYSSLVLSQGKIINPKNNKVIKEIEYLDPETLDINIQKYQAKINRYNSNLKSYEAPLTNDPKTIKVGDHSFNVVKILDKNISRLVVIEGEYKGHFVDELVSSTGEVVGSVSKASLYLTETSKGIRELNVYDKSYGLKKITNNKPFETFKKLNGIKDSTMSPDFFNKINRNYLNKLSKIVSEGKLTSDQLHKLTGLNIVSNIPNTTGISLSLESFNTNNNINSHISLELATIERDIVFNRGKPHHIHNSYFKTDQCLPDGLGSRVFAQQVKTASEMGFQYIDTHAAKGGGFVGYYVWPKLGYDTFISLRRYFENDIRNDNDQIKFNYLKKWLEKNNIDPEEDVNLSAIYACKAGDRFVGQELWYKFGNTEDMEFDLTPGSLSMRILESYINLKSKKDDIDPSEFFSIDYSRFKAIDLECILRKGGKNSLLEDAIEHNVKNYENGVIERIYKDPATRQKFLNRLNGLEDQKVIDKVYDLIDNRIVKKASDEQQSEDPILKELDMEILDQIWSGISKQYNS